MRADVKGVKPYWLRSLTAVRPKSTRAVAKELKLEKSLEDITVLGIRVFLNISKRSLDEPAGVHNNPWRLASKDSSTSGWNHAQENRYVKTPISPGDKISQK